MTTAELDLGANGVNPDRLASFREEVRVNARGRFMQIRVLNTQGRLRLRGVQIEARSGERASRPKP